MRKVAKVITTCNECQNCQQFKAVKDNYTSIYCCVFQPEDESISQTAFLLERSVSKGNHQITIPENCPLEDYKPIEL